MKNSTLAKLLILSLFLCLLLFRSCGKIENDYVAEEQLTKQWPESFGFGKEASADKIALLDIDVRPDGKGLPKGSGTYRQGRIIYDQKCSRCHGKTGTDGPYNKLVKTEAKEGKRGDLTIGDYWPYASTVFDYINRAMPYDHPGSLTADEVYSITAFLLARNELIDSTIVMDAQTLPKVNMPAKQLFVLDDRKGGAEVR